MDFLNDSSKEAGKTNKTVGKAISKGSYLLGEGNSELFDDIFWQFLAFDEGGIELMRKLNKNVGPDNKPMLGDQYLKAWEKIAKGLDKNKPDLVWDGNLALFEEGQLVILQKSVFDEMPSIITAHELFGT